MSTQITYVTYSPLSGKCKYYNAEGKEFNGDLVCPPEGCTFEWQPQAGQTGWGLSDIVLNHVSGPTVAFSKDPPQPTSISVQDPGNGEAPESWYSYTLKIETADGTIVNDPKIKNTGGGLTLDRQ